MAGSLQQVLLTLGGGVSPGQGIMAAVEGADSADFIGDVYIVGALSAIEGADLAAFIEGISLNRQAMMGGAMGAAMADVRTVARQVVTPVGALN